VPRRLQRRVAQPRPDTLVEVCPLAHGASVRAGDAALVARSEQKLPRTGAIVPLAGRGL